MTATTPSDLSSTVPTDVISLGLAFAHVRPARTVLTHAAASAAGRTVLRVVADDHPDVPALVAACAVQAGSVVLDIEWSSVGVRRADDGTLLGAAPGAPLGEGDTIAEMRLTLELAETTDDRRVRATERLVRDLAADLTLIADGAQPLRFDHIRGRAVSALESAGVERRAPAYDIALRIVDALPVADLLLPAADEVFEWAVTAARDAAAIDVRVLTVPAPLPHSTTCLVLVPLRRLDHRLGAVATEIVERHLGGRAGIGELTVAGSVLAVLRFDVRSTSQPDRAPRTSSTVSGAIEAGLRATIKTWDDTFREVLGRHPDAATSGSAQRYTEALPEAYKKEHGVERAAVDTATLESLPPNSSSLSLYRISGSTQSPWRCTLYVAGQPVTLSRVLPLLHSLAVEVVDEHPYPVRRSDGTQCWIYDFGITFDGDATRAGAGDDADLTSRFSAAFAAMWDGSAEIDGFNALVLRAGLDWRQAAMLRAYSRYLRQAAFPYSQDYIARVLSRHTDIVRRIVALFTMQFDPDVANEEASDAMAQQLNVTIDAIPEIDSDRILRSFLLLIRATLRTNYFSGTAHQSTRRALAFKLEPRSIPELPSPRPRFEIFVYSPWVEGVHLRFGAIARGGLRWSDRLEDFRTEILGLVKAQAVKNAVIVPVGAKGGFVVKQPPVGTGDADADRTARLGEGITCYREFIAGLLDLTDNVDRETGNVLTPDGVVRRDGDDTYLVVAADKGTAAFSDIANDVAAQYGFWLGDAFASGGSAGYDHKRMGITAKGAWKSVERHFRELGVDTRTDAFTAVGIGDMSGDVFGNGMLLSPALRLVAAFDHRHIFVDPDPDPSRSYAERARLFDLPTSSWEDYDRSVLSEGGDIWSRTEKSIPIDPRVRVALALPESTRWLSPTDLIAAILRTPVDLLWNGGIGTYVKASDESHADVGDKANDGVRVDARTVRARVIGEGGNLGVTALGRTEYALAGGRINSDALDNSAGVDCSDHEVNIKILLDTAVSAGTLDAEQRNPLLASMTDDVAALVLADNTSQNELLGTTRAAAARSLSVHRRQITALERHRGLVRAHEALPSEEDLGARAATGQGLVSPELSTLLAHVKLALKEDLLAGHLPDTSELSNRLPQYFPAQVRDRIAPGTAHPLAREIVTTMVINEVVDDGGLSYVHRLHEDCAASTEDAVRAFTITADVFDLRSVWGEIRRTEMPTAASDLLKAESRRLLGRGSRWFLANRPQPLAIGAEITRFAAAVRRLTPILPSWLQGIDVDNVCRRAAPAIEAGAPQDLAHRVFRSLDVFALLDIVEIAEVSERDSTEVGAVYWALNAHLEAGRLLTSVTALDRGDRWHALARQALRDDLYSSMRALCLDVLASSEPGQDPQDSIAEWEAGNSARLERARATLQSVFESNTFDLATLSVTARQLRSMARTPHLSALVH
ncbi:NAD-glutamate dehydrogenase [Rhodococcus jostii]|uniref:Glutamate dehydrogenase (NAD) n=1 Tax=Rhodococcus jostii TaxID=132919 RepID=A0A1H5H4V1_RHOJO|nr:NAD-glutamate dehydrogenase domain-containing protein [Rhodococcus jostii]SEE22721.1 glutamate dehydrogenase (NAD) [Rhodococcus jostii]